MGYIWYMSMGYGLWVMGLRHGVLYELSGPVLNATPLPGPPHPFRTMIPPYHLTTATSRHQGHCDLHFVHGVRFGTAARLLHKGEDGGTSRRVIPHHAT